MKRLKTFAWDLLDFTVLYAIAHYQPRHRRPK